MMVPAIAADAISSVAAAKVESKPSQAQAGSTGKSGRAEPVRCWIRSSLAEGLRLDAMGAADTSVSGSYEFRVKKSSVSGSSLNMQSGDFILGKTPSVLSSIMLDGSAIGHYEATLLLKWDGGYVSCSAP